MSMTMVSTAASLQQNYQSRTAAALASWNKFPNWVVITRRLMSISKSIMMWVFRSLCRIVEEPREITEMVEVVEYMEIPRVEKTPKIITEDVLETVSVPVVREVPLTRQIEVPTGK